MSTVLTLQDKIEHYLPLILYCVKKHIRTASVDHYDMISAGKLGLLKALQLYNHSSPEKYWCYRFINSEIIKLVYKRNMPFKEDNGYEEELKQVPIEDNTLPTIYQKEEVANKNAQLNRIYRLLKRNTTLLNKDNGLNRTLFEERYKHGLKLTEISNKYNLTYPSTVHRIANVTAYIKENING